MEASSWRRMRRRWDRRAREDARRYICCGSAESDDQFWEAGRRDLEDLVLHDVELSPRARALEIGCGLGRILKPLSERVEKAFGCDISPEMVERARAALADRDNVEIFATKGSLDPIDDAALDFVCSFIVFQHIPAKSAVSRYIREAARVLRPGGVFRFQVDSRFFRPSRGDSTWLGVSYRRSEIVAELEGADFEVVGTWGDDTHYLWATARRKNIDGDPGTPAVRARRRTWRREAVEATLVRMGIGDPREVEAVLAGERSLRELAEHFLLAHGRAPARDFVRAAYATFLDREVDPGGLAFYSKEIESGIVRSNTVDCLLSSAELEERLRPIVD